MQQTQTNPATPTSQHHQQQPSQSTPAGQSLPQQQRGLPQPTAQQLQQMQNTAAAMQQQTQQHQAQQLAAAGAQSQGIDNGGNAANVPQNPLSGTTIRPGLSAPAAQPQGPTASQSLQQQQQQHLQQAAQAQQLSQQGQHLQGQIQQLQQRSQQQICQSPVAAVQSQQQMSSQGNQQQNPQQQQLTQGQQNQQQITQQNQQQIAQQNQQQISQQNQQQISQQNQQQIAQQNQQQIAQQNQQQIAQQNQQQIAQQNQQQISQQNQQQQLAQQPQLSNQQQQQQQLIQQQVQQQLTPQQFQQLNQSGQVIRVANDPQQPQGLQNFNLQQMQQLQNVQQIQGVQQMQGLQSIQGLPGVHLLPMHTFQGNPNPQYIQTIFQNQLQPQLVSPAPTAGGGVQQGVTPGTPQTLEFASPQALHIQQLQQGNNSSASQVIAATNSSTSPIKSSGNTMGSGSRTVGGQNSQQPAAGGGASSQNQPPQQQPVPAVGGGQQQVPQQQLQQQVASAQQQQQLQLQRTGQQSQAAAQSLVIGPNQQLRFASPQALVNSGQIIGNMQPMQFQTVGGLTPQTLSLAQPIFQSQAGGTILSSQPVYIRTTGPIQNQPQIIQMAHTGTKSKDNKQNIAGIIQGVRAIGPGLQAVPMGPLSTGSRMKSPNQHQRLIRPLRSQKVSTIQRQLQPKPPVSQPQAQGDNQGNNTKLGMPQSTDVKPVMVSTAADFMSPTKKLLGENAAGKLTAVINSSSAHNTSDGKVEQNTSLVSSMSKPAVTVPPISGITSTQSSTAYSKPSPATTSIIQPSVMIATAASNTSAIATATNSSSVTSHSMVASSISVTNVSSAIPVSEKSNAAVATPTTSNSKDHVTTSTTVSSHSNKRLPLATEPKAAPPGTDFVVTKSSEKKQAIVKPVVLTHVIEGFVILESSEPFPVHRHGNGSSNQEDKKKSESPESTAPTEPPPTHCAICNRELSLLKQRLSKRFCTNKCAKKYNVSCSQRVNNKEGRKRLMLTKPGQQQQEMQLAEDGIVGASEESTAAKKARHSAAMSEYDFEPETEQTVDNGDAADINSLQVPPGDSEVFSDSVTMGTDQQQPDVASVAPAAEESVSSPSKQLPAAAPVSPTKQVTAQNEGDNIPKKPLQQWNVDDVYHFLNNLPGCAEYAQQFLSQEIDGQALMLLKEDHLMTTMSIKLGPALKICATIKQILEEKQA